MNYQFATETTCTFNISLTNGEILHLANVISSPNNNVCDMFILHRLLNKGLIVENKGGIVSYLVTKEGLLLVRLLQEVGLIDSDLRIANTLHTLDIGER